MDHIAMQALSPDVICTFSPVDISNIMWAFASLGIQNVTLIRTLGEQAAQPDALLQLDFQVCFAQSLVLSG